MPQNLGSPHPMYSIGYPALIAPLVRWRPNSPFQLLSVFHTILAVLGFISIRKWASGVSGLPASLIANLTFANVVMLAIFRRDLSEVAFVPVLFVTVNMLNGVGESLPSPGCRKPLLAGSVLLLLVTIRPTGMLVGCGFALLLAVSVAKRQFSWSKAMTTFFVVVAPAIGLLGVLMAFEQITAGQSREITNFDMLLNHRLVEAQENLGQRLLEGCRVRISEVGRLTVPGMFGAFVSRGNWRDWNLLLYIPVIALVCRGWWKWLNQRAEILALTFPCYFLLHVYWPWDQAGRYFAPLLPALFVCLWYGIGFVGTRRLRLFQILLVLHLAVSVGFWLVRELPRGIQNQRDWSALQCLVVDIRGDMHTVAASTDTGDAGLMLAWLLDRPLPQFRSGERIPGEVHWMLILEDETPPPEFAIRARQGRFLLAERSE